MLILYISPGALSLANRVPSAKNKPRNTKQISKNYRNNSTTILQDFRERNHELHFSHTAVVSVQPSELQFELYELQLENTSIIYVMCVSSALPDISRKGRNMPPVYEKLRNSSEGCDYLLFVDILIDCCILSPFIPNLSVMCHGHLIVSQQWMMHSSNRNSHFFKRWRTMKLFGAQRDYELSSYRIQRIRTLLGHIAATLSSVIDDLVLVL
ncbi:unnamed protein product [Lepeophtheirus salmonis]|uniref:(salmon louse) hypothetical protein n=1 Tax=Lepeophtheirus salmonis TaxID=72036 RepID=A0A7R8CJR4_LEPSM|nr:unnamed protein product [Lepeophtheirus salmonis]CAF2844182.1 unnamed protein product [Lepeophtheirus salmonis]